jgi:hypothetical protein
VVGETRVWGVEGQRSGGRGRGLVDPAGVEQRPSQRVVPVDVLPNRQLRLRAGHRCLDAPVVIGGKQNELAVIDRSGCPCHRTDSLNEGVLALGSHCIA